MCREWQDDPYDACIKITDMGWLAHRIFFRGVIPELGGAKMSNICKGFTWQDVTYDVLRRDASMGQTPSPSPFLKDIHFARQREIRIVFVPREPTTRSTFTVQIPKPGHLFDEMFRVVPASS